jgi:hypothetical protein
VVRALETVALGTVLKIVCEGNPGGGTFHAVVFEHEGDCSYSLIDEPFEDVPEGGPDLTADEARAHDTLPFVCLGARPTRVVDAALAAGYPLRPEHGNLREA